MEKIINHVGLEVYASLKAREKPAGKPLPHKDESSIGRKFVWNYREAVGMLSYLQVLTRPEIPMAVHQCEIFCNNLYLVHKCAIRQIAKYLASTSTYVDLPDGNWWLNTHGIVYKPIREEFIKCDVDANFDGGWAQSDSDNA